MSGQGMEMIVEKRRYTNYSIVDNEIIEHAALSFRARGVLIYLLSRPDGWRTSSDRLARQTTEGRDAMRTCIKELEDAGYIERRKTQGENGRWSTHLRIYDLPNPKPQVTPTTDSQSSVEPTTDFQSSDFQSSVNQSSVSQSSLTITESNNSIPITEEVVEADAPRSSETPPPSSSSLPEVGKSPAAETPPTSRENRDYPESFTRAGYWPTGDIFEQTMAIKGRANVISSMTKFRHYLITQHPRASREWADNRWLMWIADDAAKLEEAYEKERDAARVQQLVGGTAQKKKLPNRPTLGQVED